jgi:hypothetical protein
VRASSEYAPETTLQATDPDPPEAPSSALSALDTHKSLRGRGHHLPAANLLRPHETPKGYAIGYPPAPGTTTFLPAADSYEP